MTAERFRQLAIKLFGPERGWQTRCAEALGTDRASVSRWISGAVPTVPGPVAAAMECWNKNNSGPVAQRYRFHPGERAKHILAMATKVFGSKADAEQWMMRPATGLEQRRPIELLATSAGAKIVEDFLGQLEYGAYS